MKRHSDALFDEIISVPNLWAAWRTFRRGKRNRPTVRRFDLDADRRVLQLHRALAAHSWRPSGYRLRVISRPKRRLIAAAPVRDRIVHHAIHRVLAPRLDPGLIEHTYACLPGRGSHRAVLAFARALRRHRHVLCLDVRHYFLSIDHDILLAVMARKLEPGRLMSLLARIIASGDGLYTAPAVAAALDLPPGFPPPRCGLPIGNLTSQRWGNHYLSGLDHHLARDLRVPHVQRYMDDITLMADDPRVLRRARAAAGDWLARERRLALKRPDAPIRGARDEFTYLGYRVSRHAIRAGRATDRQLRDRLHAHIAADRADRTDGVTRAERSLAAYRGVYTGPHAFARVTAGLGGVS